MARKIAIITSRDTYCGYDDEDYQRIIESITDWDEVTDEEFKTLQFAAPRLGFSILERPIDAPKFIAKTIADYKAICKAEAEREAAEREKREKAALERKFKKELKDKVSKEKMLAKLAADLGVEVVQKS